MAEDLPFVDANIFLRHFTQDHPDHSPRATAFLGRVEAGEERARTADTVVFADCFHIALMEGLSLSVMASFDRKISQIRTVTRKEPDIQGKLF